MRFYVYSSILTGAIAHISANIMGAGASGGDLRVSASDVSSQGTLGQTLYGWIISGTSLASWKQNSRLTIMNYQRFHNHD